MEFKTKKSWYLPDLRPIREKLNIQLDEIGSKAIFKNSSNKSRTLYKNESSFELKSVQR